MACLQLRRCKRRRHKYQRTLYLHSLQVALIHLFQAGMFADRAAVTALTDIEETTPRMRSAAGGWPVCKLWVKHEESQAFSPACSFRRPCLCLCINADEVRATLAAGGCPLPLIMRAEQAYRAASHQVHGCWHCRCAAAAL